jgi:hypothetical protein
VRLWKEDPYEKSIIDHYAQWHEEATPDTELGVKCDGCLFGGLDAFVEYYSENHREAEPFGNEVFKEAEIVSVDGGG